MPKSSGRYQFGIRRLLILTTAVALIVVISIRLAAPRLVQVVVAAYFVFLVGWMIMRLPSLYVKLAELCKRADQVAERRVTLEADALKAKQAADAPGGAAESEHD
jgi:hypothetical protein